MPMVAVALVRFPGFGSGSGSESAGGMGAKIASLFGSQGYSHIFNMLSVPVLDVVYDAHIQWHSVLFLTYV